MSAFSAAVWILESIVEASCRPLVAFGAPSWIVFEPGIWVPVLLSTNWICSEGSVPFCGLATASLVTMLAMLGWSVPDSGAPERSATGTEGGTAFRFEAALSCGLMIAEAKCTSAGPFPVGGSTDIVEL